MDQVYKNLGIFIVIAYSLRSIGTLPLLIIVFSLAAMFPLFFNIATEEQAEKVAATIKKDFLNWLNNYPGKLPMSKEELDNYLKERNY